MDMLEIRFNTLNDVVEKFVVVESNMTHSGKPRKLMFDIKRFEKFEDKIIYLVHHGVPNTIPNFNPWINENAQRNTIINVLLSDRPKDGMLFISDADEIARPDKLVEAVNLCLKNNTPITIQMTNSMYYFNMIDKNIPWYGPYIFKHPFHEDLSTLRWHCCDKTYKFDFPSIENGGWHFSTMGGVDKIKIKLESYAHSDLNTPEINSTENLTKCMESGKIFCQDVYGEELPQYKKVEDLSFLPPYVLNNIERFKDYII
jgi:beta-1,4-mannosyl-glycoprotein beta-1,4-N-acetylglucosaminyltransferase